LTKIEEQETIIINRPGRSTYPEQKSVLTSGATPVSGKPKIAHMLEGVDSLQLSVPILANPLRKHTEIFYVVIARPEGGASLGSIRRASVFIMRPD